MFYPLFLQAVDNISLKTSKSLLFPNWYFRLDMHCGHNRLSVDMLCGPVGDKSGIYVWIDAGNFNPRRIRLSTGTGSSLFCFLGQPLTRGFLTVVERDQPRQVMFGTKQALTLRETLAVKKVSGDPGIGKNFSTSTSLTNIPHQVVGPASYSDNRLLGSDRRGTVFHHYPRRR